MNLHNNYKVIYEKAAEGKRTFYASTSNSYPTENDILLASFNDSDYQGKVIFEHEGKIYVSAGNIPTYTENGEPTGVVIKNFDRVLNLPTDNITGVVLPVNAAKVADVEYSSLTEAIAAAEENQIVVLLKDFMGEGFVVNKSITIDFNGYTYTITEPVGSKGTETNGLQLLKNNNIILKNGTLNIAESEKARFYILVQNYSNLTVENMVLDGTNLDKWSSTDGDSYTLSNNSGIVNIIGETTIIANEDGNKAFAFDVCKYSNYSAPVVNVSTSGTIIGNIEVTSSIATNLNIASGKFTREIENAWCAEGFIPVSFEDGTYGVQANN